MYSKKMPANDVHISASDRVHLRLTRMSDVPALYKLITAHRSQLREWLGWVDYATGPDYVTKFVQRSIDQFRRNDGFQACILYDDIIVGSIGFHSIDWFNRNASLGYWLAGSYTGNGIMTTATKAMIDYAFSAYGLHRVEIRCATKNEKSIRIPERFGFQQEGLLHEVEWLPSGYVDHIVYGLLKKNWKNARTTF
ncbi:GNAT family N-acetyltransferase [Aureibacillus halotolerans]|uniref:Ribosomal-protein-serine acetyltransferase n=1 Tax=Aureibacillus halotolerans TaxID=1508390 RepID=A0A4R6U331_9BACI|nr:GNAT family protein [Aureibacillus halotolerans]TDQ40411.1 ribosomal-protein-serine acetyltransferase [Aureibacillus halotolerans]